MRARGDMWVGGKECGNTCMWGRRREKLVVRGRWAGWEEGKPREKTAAAGHCQTEPSRGNRWPRFAFLNCKCCLCKVRSIQNILLWARITTEHCSEWKEMKFHCKAIPTNDRPDVSVNSVCLECACSVFTIGRGPWIQDFFLSLSSCWVELWYILMDDYALNLLLGRRPLKTLSLIFFSTPLMWRRKLVKISKWYFFRSK